VADIFAHHAKATLLGVALNGVRDIAQPPAGPREFERVIQRLLGHVEQILCRFGNTPDRIAPGRVAMVALPDHADVDADDIAFTQHARPRDAVNDLLV